MRNYKDVNDLNELETREILQELAGHIERNNWRHLFDELEYVSNLLDEIGFRKMQNGDLKKAIQFAIDDIDKIATYLRVE